MTLGIKRVGRHCTTQHMLNNTAIVTLLLKSRKVDVNAIGDTEKTPLFLAAERERVEFVVLFLEHKDVDVNAVTYKQGTVCTIAVKYQSSKTEHILTRSGKGY